jgi:hypothetical protein
MKRFVTILIVTLSTGIASVTLLSGCGAKEETKAFKVTGSGS